jgi:hypothetical protein
LAVGVFHLLGSFAGAFATFILGILGDKYQANLYPERYGILMGSAVLISYVSCCPFFMLAGREYAKQIR